MITKNNFAFVVKKESVTVWQHQNYLGQALSFNIYSLQSRKRFNKFKKEIIDSAPDQFDNINDIYGLARKHDVRATHGHKPVFKGRIAF